MKVEIPKLKCKRCPHEWIPRTDDVRTCPKCRSPYWDKPRKGEQPQAETKQDPPKIFQAGPGPIYRPETETKEPTVIQPQDMPAKSKPREATESEKKAFLCAYSHKFNCPAYDTKKPAY
jgi:hypothetical protein